MSLLASHHLTSLVVSAGKMTHPYTPAPAANSRYAVHESSFSVEITPEHSTADSVVHSIITGLSE